MTIFDSRALPLDVDQTDKLQYAVADLTAAQLQWVSGYVAGLAAGSGAEPGLSAERSSCLEHREQLTVLFGSQTGNGEAVAEALVRNAKVNGYAAKSISMADYRPADLKRESLLSIVVSTHGDGDPPDDAELFYEYLVSNKAPQLQDLRYSLLALGDSSYANFCKTGRDFDARLTELGARQFEPTVECDLDYDEDAASWSNSVVAKLPALLNKSPTITPLHAVPTTRRFDRRNPYSAEVLVNQRITGSGSSKDVRHIELSLGDSGIRYEVGDALGVIARNPPQLVEELLVVLGLDPAASIRLRDESMNLGEAMSARLEITAVNLSFLRAWAQLSGNGRLDRLLESDDKVQPELLDAYQIIDIVREFPAAVSAQSFVDSLRALSPRSYSIASSPDANPGEVHLTVAAVRYDAFGTRHWGAASTFLADRVAEGDPVSVYVETNKRFRLVEPERPIIMIGPGTGVAPFRAFIEQRKEQRASGDSWLFFGDRNANSDFLYQLEWQRYLRDGHLTRMDVAFSRDQPDKLYVQHRIAENAAELLQWIDRGAAIYVCGDAKRMAHDVQDAIIKAFETEARLDKVAAEQRLKDMRRAGRYQRDVY